MQYMLVHQYSLLSRGTRTEQHYLRINTTYDMSATSSTQQLVGIVRAIFFNALELFVRAAAGLRGTYPNIVPPITGRARVQMRMYTREGSNNIESDPSFMPDMFTGGVVTRIVRYDQLTLQMILEILLDKIQSAETWILDEDTVIVFTLVRVRAGGGKTKFLGELNKSKSVVSFQRDSMCAARAMVYWNARAYQAQTDFRLVRIMRLPMQKQLALALHAKSTVPIRPEGVSFSDLDKFADAMQMQVFVIDDYSVTGRTFEYRTPNVYDHKCVLYYEDAGAGK
jgi:hypothetical protein